MKQITKLDLIGLIGGSTMGDCDWLQDMANEHETLMDEAAEDAWWDAWGEAFERCAGN